MADYRQAALGAFQEVETSKADVRQYQPPAAARRRDYRTACQASALTKERDRAGLTTCFEVVNADRQTLEAATLLTQAQSNLPGPAWPWGGRWAAAGNKRLNRQILHRFCTDFEVPTILVGTFFY